MADIAEGALRVAQKRVDAGKAPPLERNRAEIELTKAQIDVRQAENDLRVARRELSLLWETQSRNSNSCKRKLMICQHVGHSTIYALHC